MTTESTEPTPYDDFDAERDEMPEHLHEDDSGDIVIPRALLTNIAIAVIFLALGLVTGALFGTGIVLSNSAILANTFSSAVVEAMPEGIPAAGGQNPTNPPAAQAPTAIPSNVGEVSVDDDPFLGPEDAPVTIIEFSDFRCPFCQRFHLETLPIILEEYEGEVRYVFRDFPVVGGQRHAEAANCANEQGGFWGYHEALFANPQAYSSADDYVALAEELGLEGEDFRTCFGEGRYREEINNDASDAQFYGVTGTPTFFINGERLVGAQPFANFAEVIDAALAEAGGR